MKPALLVHGGAGLFAEARIPDCIDGSAEALRAGYAVLDAGGSALDAVVEAVRVMEDLPSFNAGTGSVLNADGDVEMDACVMTGALGVGAVGAVRRIRNPIRLARLVMERSPHVLLVADGAERFARQHGVATCSPAELITPAQLDRFRRGAAGGPPGTVGAVAIDATGALAAATSTGGIAGKLPGRVGDTPVPGAGTWADEELGAASATGKGEAILKVALSRLAVEGLAKGLSPAGAARAAVDVLARRTRSEAGVIVISKSGETGWAFNTRRMARAWRKDDGSVHSAVEPDA